MHDALLKLELCCLLAPRNLIRWTVVQQQDRPGFADLLVTMQAGAQATATIPSSATTRFRGAGWSPQTHPVPPNVAGCVEAATGRLCSSPHPRTKPPAPPAEANWPSVHWRAAGQRHEHRKERNSDLSGESASLSRVLPSRLHAVQPSDGGRWCHCRASSTPQCKSSRVRSSQQSQV